MLVFSYDFDPDVDKIYKGTKVAFQQLSQAEQNSYTIRMFTDDGPVIATTGSVGVVKPDGTTITIDQDGTIHSVNNNVSGATEIQTSGAVYSVNNGKITIPAIPIIFKETENISTSEWVENGYEWCFDIPINVSSKGIVLNQNSEIFTALRTVDYYVYQSADITAFNKLKCETIISNNDLSNFTARIIYQSSTKPSSAVYLTLYCFVLDYYIPEAPELDGD